MEGSLERLFHHTPNLSNNLKNMEMMMMSERKNNRGKIQIMGDVTGACNLWNKKDSHNVQSEPQPTNRCTSILES